MNSRNAQMKMTRTVLPDNGHAHTCFTTDVFLLENTCSVDQRPEGYTEGHPKPVTPYVRAAPRRLLAARSKDAPETTLKMQVPRRQIKNRSLKRSHAPREELAIGSQRREAISTRKLLAARNGERTASERTDATRRSLFMERGVQKKTVDKPLSRKISELKVPRRASAEIQPPSITAAEQAALAKEGVSRKMSTEMRTSRRTMERKMPEKDESRRLAFENRFAPERSAGREFNVHSRASTERRSLLRVSRDHRLYQYDSRKLSVERKSDRSVSTDSRNRELTVSRTTSATTESSRRIQAEYRLPEYGNSRRISSGRQSSPRLASDRISEKLFRSRVSSKPNFSDDKLSRSASSDIRQDDSRNIRAVSERAQISRLTTERFGSERRSSSRVAQAEGRRSYGEGSLSRGNSLHEAVNSKRRCSTKRFPEKNINSEGITAVRRTARSISSHTSTNSRVSSIFPFTSVIRSSGRLNEGRPSMKSHDRVFRSLPSVQLLSSSSEVKKNEKQSSEPLSRIKPRSRSLIIPRDKPSSRTLTDRTQTSMISNERLLQISSNRLSPSRNSKYRNAAYRTADNRRNSATAFEERRNMQLSREGRSLSSESSHRRSSFMKTEESLSSSFRSSPLNSIVTTRFSEERRVSRVSPIIRRLLTTSTARLSANISDRRLDQTVSSRLSEFTASRRMSNERVSEQRSKMRRTVSPSVSDKRLSTETPAYRNNHVTKSIAGHNLIRTSAERALVLKDTKREHAENIIALTDSSGVSTTRITSEKDSRSTKGLLSTRDSRKVSAKQRTPVTGLKRVTERLNSAKFSGKISAERLTSEKDHRRSAERLASVGDSMRISAERLRLSRSSENSAYAKFYRRVPEKRLMPQRNSKRYDEGLAPIKNSRRVSAARRTSERQSRMSDKPFSQARDSMRITPDSRRLSESAFHFRDSKKLSAERQALEKNSRRSIERSLSVRNSRSISTGLKNPTDSSRSEEHLSLLSNSRKNLAERTATLRYLKSTESLPLLGISRASSRGLEHQRSSKGSAERLVSLRHSRIDIGRIKTQRNSRSVEHFTPLRDSRRTSTELLVTRHYRPLEHLTSSRDSRTISTERLTSQRSVELPGQFETATDSTRSSERINVNRNYRITDERVAFIRASRSISSERLPFKRNSRVTSTVRTARRTNGDLASTTRHKISPEEKEIQNNFKLSAVRVALVKGSRSASTEHLSQGSRRSAERIPTILGTRKTTAIRQISERNLSRKTERSSYARNPKMSSNRWAYERESRRTVKPLASVDSRKVTAERYSSRSVEHLTSVRSSRISTDLKTMRNSGRPVDRFTSVTNSGIPAERIGSDRRSANRVVSSRDFRRGYTEPLESETNSERSLVGLATNLNSRRIYTERRVSEKNSKRPVGYSANLRNTHRLSTNVLSLVRNPKAAAERLKSLGSSVRVTHERQPVSKKSTSDNLATSKSMDRVSTRIISSERRISQPEHLSTIRTTRMSNMRNTRQANGHISKNQALHQGFGLPEKYFSTMDNTTLKTESFFGIALSMETIQKSAMGFMSTQYSNWSEKVTEYVNCVLATLTVMWPTLAIWKEGVTTSLISFDGESAFSPKMDHLNSFFTDKVNCLHSKLYCFRSNVREPYTEGCLDVKMHAL